MSDQLENFIRSNREAFDDKEPDEKNWDVIEAALARSKKKNLWNSITLWRVAAMLFMALSIYLYLVAPTGLNTKSDSGKLALKEFTDIEAFYTKEISQKVKLINEISEGEVENEFTQDLQQLDAMFFVLKEEMKSRPSKKVKDALVLNLLVRINLLNQQLHRLELEYKEDEEKETSI